MRYFKMDKNRYSKLQGLIMLFPIQKHIIHVPHKSENELTTGEVTFAQSW
jgi:hypothetical protein